MLRRCRRALFNSRALEHLLNGHFARVARLEAQVQALTDAAIARETELQNQRDRDYQVVMAHQQTLAGLQDADSNFHAVYDRCKSYTMTSIERLYSLYKCAEYVVASEVAGDVVECGVWRGGSCMLVALAFLERSNTERRIVLYDTFEGHPKPDAEMDVDLWGNRAVDEWQRYAFEGRPWGDASLDEVHRNLEATGYPREKLVFVKGLVEETVPQNLPDKIAILRLDTDWYESTRVELFHLYPRLVPGGVLIVDDYGHYKGQRKAVDEYFRGIGENLLFHRIDYSCRVALKPWKHPRNG